MIRINIAEPLPKWYHHLIHIFKHIMRKRGMKYIDQPSRTYFQCIVCGQCLRIT